MTPKQEKLDREHELLRNHICNCQHCKLKAKCFICGTNNGLHRCHIVPRAIIGVLHGRKWNKDKWMSYSGMNIVILCVEHHRQFDNFKLRDEHKEIMFPIVKEVITTFYNEMFNEKLVEMINSPKYIDKFIKQIKKTIEYYPNEFDGLSQC